MPIHLDVDFDLDSRGPIPGCLEAVLNIDIMSPFKAVNPPGAQLGARGGWDVPFITQRHVSVTDHIARDPFACFLELKHVLGDFTINLGVSNSVLGM